MEFGPPRVEDDDDEELEAAPEAPDELRSERNTWQSISERFKLLFAPEEENEDDEDDDEGDPKKKRRSKLVAIFQRHNIAAKSLETEEAPRSRPETPLTIPHIVTEEAAPNEQSQQQTAGEPVSLPEQPTENVSEPEDDEADELAPVPPVQAAGDIPLPPPPVEQLPPSHDSAEHDPPDDEPPIPPLPPMPPAGMGGGFTGEPPMPPRPHAADAAPPIEPTPTTVINNIEHIENRPANIGPALVGSLIVNRLSKNRDARLQKQIEAVKDKVETSDNRHALAEADRAQKQRQLFEQQERLRRENQPEHPAAAPSPQPERQATPHLSHKAETTPKPRTEAQNNIQSTPELRRQTHNNERPIHMPEDKSSTGVRPEAAPPNYEAVAPSNEWFAPDHERRFEVKDQTTADNEDASGTTMQRSIDPFRQDTAQDIERMQASLAKQHRPMPQPSSSNGSQPMKTAALVGVATALTIVAVIIIVALVR